MIKALYTTGTASAGHRFTNELQLGGALLPDRFESTSIPVYPTGQVSELGAGEHYDLPTVSETPVIEVVGTTDE